MKVQLKAVTGEIGGLADALCEAFEEFPEQAHRLKLREAISKDGMPHGGMEDIEYIELDYSDITPEMFELVQPFIKTIIRLAELLSQHEVKIEFVLKG